MTQQQDLPRALGSLLEAIAAGDITSADFLPLDPEVISRGWQIVKTRVLHGSKDDTLIPLIERLRAADPDFESSDLLLALVHINAGRGGLAAHFLQQQIAHPSEKHRDHATEMLQILERESPASD